MTAQRVAAHRLTYERMPAPYGDPQADLDLAREVAAGSQASTGRMHDYLRSRTTFFDRVVVGALEGGIAQVVIGAAGYDGRAYRYAKPGVRWFELDHPSTQRDKVARLAHLGIATSHVSFVAADFVSDPVAEMLLAAGVDSKSRSLILLEGVAVYLDPAVLERLLQELRQIAFVGSRLAISVSVAAPDAAARAGFRRAVASMGEPLRSTLEPQEAGVLLKRTGWELLSNDATDADSRVHRERLRSAGFLLATAATSTDAGETDHEQGNGWSRRR